MHIHGFQKTTLLDYPGHLAATIFLGGCNMRCPFCHNASLVLGTQKQNTISKEEVLSLLSKRKQILEGVCITGGEPTLAGDLPEMIEEIKALGLNVKLDTNGSNPAMVSDLMSRGLIDYIAMDIKNSPDKYARTSGISHLSMASIKESVNLIKNGGIPYEFRTTVVREFHEAEDFLMIGQWIHGAAAYFLQSFLDSGDILSQGLHAYDKKELEAFKEIVRPYVKEAAIRGVD